MNVLALYDIHGNIDALEAVLADPRAAGADAVVVGGDVLPGPLADETLARISAAGRWAEALGGVDAPLVVAGHTHQQDDRMVGDVRFVNCGSVGLPYEGDGAARWAWVADGVPELRRTEYDAAAAGRRMLAAGWPDERSIRAALLDPVESGVITQIFEELATR